MDLLTTYYPNYERVIANGYVYSKECYGISNVLYIPIDRYMVRMLNIDGILDISHRTTVLDIPACSSSMQYQDGRLLLSDVTNIHMLPRLVQHNRDNNVVSISPEWLVEGNWL